MPWDRQTVWQTSKTLVLGFWEWFCWLVVPAVFGYLCYGSIHKKFEVNLLQVCLAAIAVSPWILRLLSKYLSEFDIGPKGVSGKIRETTKNKADVEANGMVYFANAVVPPNSSEEFNLLAPETKKVIRTLWKYQVEHFGPDDIRRWGFSVGINSPDYPSFIMGIAQPLMKHLIAMDQRGFVFLTDSGIAFCSDNNAEIAAHPYHYSRFSN